MNRPPRYLGTALTLRTCIGFLITTASIRMMPLLVERVGWRWAFAFLAPGPMLGIVAMMRLMKAEGRRQRAEGRRQKEESRAERRTQSAERRI